MFFNTLIQFVKIVYFFPHMHINWERGNEIMLIKRVPQVTDRWQKCYFYYYLLVKLQYYSYY